LGVHLFKRSGGVFGSRLVTARTRVLAVSRSESNSFAFALRSGSNPTVTASKQQKDPKLLGSFFLSYSLLKQSGNSANLAVVLERVAQVRILDHSVSVSAANLLGLDVTLLLKVVDDGGCATLSNAHQVREFGNSNLRILRELNDHVAVIAEECPTHGSSLIRKYKTGNKLPVLCFPC
jgi:hypothetical protein